MAKHRGASKRDRDKAKQAARQPAKSVRRLERRLAELADEQRTLHKRVAKLTRRLEAAPPPFPPPFPPGPGGRGGPPWKRGRPPWAGGVGPVVSLEVPLETDDPTAPLWATVAARLPEEITTVTDDGRVACYRYSAAGSTPQAPRYRRLADPPAAPGPPPPEPFPG